MKIRQFFSGLLFTAAGVFATGGPALAAEGDIDRENRIVYITGDNWVDDCRVYVDGDEIEIELRVYDSDGNLDDTDTRDYDIDDVDLIIFYGFEGDDDFWNSTPVPCKAYGGGGNDVLLGGWADDDLYGGAGSDYLAGRSGDDDLYGEGGSDYLYGGSGSDYLKAGIGEDEWVIAGQAGADRFANPASINWWSRFLVPLQRTVFYEDFNPQEDTQYLFFAPMLVTPVTSVFPITP